MLAVSGSGRLRRAALWSILVCVLLSGTLAADVLVLKDGRKIGGKVVDKGLHYELTTEAGLRTFLSDEVESIVTSPKELLGDSEKVFEEAKEEFKKASDVAGADSNVAFREVLAKLAQVRQTYVAARELFPEDKYSDLDQRLVQVMQLTRLCRDRLGSELAKRPEARSPAEGRPATTTIPLEEVFGILLDPVKRNDPARRAAAREFFRLQRVDSPELYDVATAAMLYLSRSEADWKLQGSSLAALQEYFAKPWLREGLKLDPVGHLEAAAFLAERVAALRKADSSATTEPIALFSMGHLGQAPPGPEAERVARLLGLVVRNGIAGTPEGHVVRDLDAWIAAGEFDLAVLARVKEHSSIDTPVVRYVWSYALLRLAQQKKRGFDRPVAALATLPAADPVLRDHLAALTKSIKAAAVCSNCQGEGRLRCTNCHGVKEVRIPCPKCNGKGRLVPAGLIVTHPNKQLRRLPTCSACKGTGVEKVFKCDKCKDGYVACKQCDGKPKPPPGLEDLCALTPCPQCDGRGTLFKKVLVACKSCMGVGQRLAPKADPSKTLQ